MKQSYIETYENEDGDIVLLYVGKLNFGETSEPECMVIKKEDISAVIEALDNEM